MGKRFESRLWEQGLLRSSATRTIIHMAAYARRGHEQQEGLRRHSWARADRGRRPWAEMAGGASADPVDLECSGARRVRWDCPVH